MKGGVKNVRGVTDDFGCLSKALLAENLCHSSDRQSNDFRAHCSVLQSVPVNMFESSVLNGKSVSSFFCGFVFSSMKRP